jgi:hypothetical protein
MMRSTFSVALLLELLFALRSANADTWAFVHPPDQFKSTALLDLRNLNEPIAGQSGFVRVGPDGGFVRGDGAPIRFWACGTEVYTADPQTLARHSRFLAKIGVNMVRIHAQICGAGHAPALTDVNQKQIDAIWRAVAAFKREGIYVTISPYWAMDRPATRWGIDGYEAHTDLWGLLFFNDTLQKGYKAWERQLYCQTNPYTGVPLARDPAVAIIEVQNEDGMFFFTMDAMKPPQRQLLGRKFAQWLTAKYGSLYAAWDTWGDISEAGDEFADGDVAILPVFQWSQPHRAAMARRLRDQLEFFADVERNFYTDMVKFYRDQLGCGQLINGSNWLTADAVRLNDVERYCNTPAEVMAVNKYFNAVHTGHNVGWRIDPGDCFTDRPAVLNPWYLPTNLKQSAGHPMIVTESSWVPPMDFQNEGPLLIAAYESLTGVAGYYWFTATAEQYLNDPRIPFARVGDQFALKKWTCSTPELMGNFPAAALMYRSGYLRRGEPVVVENRPLADLWQEKRPLIAEDPSFDPNRMSGQPGQMPQARQTVDPLAFLVGPVIVNYGGDPKDDRIADLTQNIDPQRKIVISNTNQIRLDYSVGLCSIDAPAAQGATGLLKSAGRIHLSTIDIDSANRQASVLVVSMDGKPLSESARILIQVGTPARLAGWSQVPANFNENGKPYDGFKILSTGQPPWLVENAEVNLTIRNPHLTEMTTLDTAGYPLKSVATNAADGVINLKFPAGTMYAILQ